MKKIDLYIIKRFLATFVFTIGLISVVSIAIDLSEKITRLMKNKAPIDGVIFEYYLNFIPWISGLLIPIFVLISVMYFTSRLAKNNEIIAIFNAGVSYRRLLFPYMVAAGIVALVLLLAGMFVIPRSTKIKNAFENEYIMKGNRQVDVDHVHFYLGKNEKAYIRYFRLRDTTMQGFRIEKFENNELVSILKSEKLEFIKPPNHWRLHGYTQREIHGLKENIKFEKEKLDTMLPFTPDDFIRYTNDMETMTSPELRRYIEYEEQRGINNSTKYLAEIQRRYSDPFSVFILTILGVTISSRKTRGGAGINLAIGVCFAGMFVFIQRFSLTFTQGNVIPPNVGMWVPNIIFFLIVLWLIGRAQK